jgi:YVTN family beta-propeller protein
MPACASAFSLGLRRSKEGVTVKKVPTVEFSFSRLVFVSVLTIAWAIMLILSPTVPAQTIGATLNVGVQPQAVAVNPVTNQIYAAVSQGVSVIDGATGAVSTVTAGTNPVAVAVNVATNRIYVANHVSNNVSVIDGSTNTVTATLTVGTGPVALAVNSVTNQIYVASRAGSSFTVIDGATNTPTTVSLGAPGINPAAVAVNPVTNKIYVVESTGKVAVVDGTNNTFANVTVGSLPGALAVNPVTNQIYVANASSGTVTVIDGATNKTTPVTVGTDPTAVAVNPVTNKIYVANTTANTMTVIDGTTNGTTSVTVGKLPQGIAVDPLTNQIYVTNATDGTVTVVDGATNTPGATPLTAGTNPIAIGVNPVTNKMYVANVQSNTVSVIDGAINATKQVTVGSGPFAADVNPVTNKIYVANHQGNTVTVIDGATNATSSPVTVDTNPEAVAVNPVTNKIYVASQANPSVTAIDGATNTPTTIALPAGTTCPCASGPTSVAVDTVLNKIYVSNDNSNTVTVIDGSTNTAKALTAGTGPNAIAVDPAIFKIYVANRGSSNVTVIDGASDFNPGTTTAGAGTLPEAIAVNLVTNEVFAADNGSNDISVLFFDTFNTFISAPALNQPTSIAVNPASSQIWVANNGSNTATVFAGTHGTAQTVTVGNGPDGLTINPATNKIYVSNFTDNTISVIDATSITPVLTGTAGAPATLTAGTGPGNSVVNRITNKTYVANFNSGNVTVVTEQNSQAIPLTVAITPLVNDQTVSATPTFTFTTSSAYSPNAPTPQSVYFQLDTLQGQWVAASGAHPAFTATTSTLTLGAHIIYAFATDGQSQDSEGSGAIGQIQAYYFNVMRPASSTALMSSKNPSGSGETVTFTATVTGSVAGTPTGEVNFLDGTTVLGTSPLSGGQASFNTSTLSLGSHSITAAYSGDTNFDSSTSNVVTQNVLGATTTIVISSLNPSLPGQSVTFTASVSASSGTPTGSVTFMDGANTLATVTLSAQQASLNTSSLAQGSHAITAVYGGDANFAGSTSAVLTQVVLAATTTSVVSGVNPSVLNQSVTFTATVSSGLGTPTGTVTFTDGANPLGTSTLINGQANFSTAALSLGSHSIVAAYAGDSNFQPSRSGALTQVVLAGTSTSLVSSVNPSDTSQPVTFSAMVSANSGTPTGTVTFKDGSSTLGTGTLSGGQASFTTPPLSFGSHSVTAVYGGDANFAVSTSAVLNQVVLDATATSVVSSLNPSSANQQASFTATVKSSAGGTPTGIVTFLDTGVILGNGMLSGGQVTFTIRLGLGSHSITAIYSGDATFGPSLSPVLTQVVLTATSTVVTPSVNPSGLNENVTFTAAVSAASGTPTGTVTFKDGASTLGTATLSAGQAAFSATTLTPGSHSITAVYGGDANFGGSTSSVLTQVVTSQPPDFAVATNSASATVAAGQSTTFNFTITPNNGFISQINFSCSGQPAGVACSFNPQTVTPNGSGTITTMLTVSTTTSVATMNAPLELRAAATLIAGYRLWLPGTLGLAGLLLAGRRKQPRQRKKSGLLLSALFLGLAVAGLAGCGGSSHPPATATFNVVATSGGTSHSTSVTLTITH